MSAWTRVAQVVKTKNLKGSVIAHSAEELPFLLFEGLKVSFTPPSLEGPRQATVSRVQFVKDGIYEVDFEGVDSIDQAQALVGSYCLAARSDLPAETDEEASTFDLIGYTVEDRVEGILGTVGDLLASSVQEVLVVEGAHGQVMIPFVDAFIIEVDHASKRIDTCIPSGLVGLSDSSGGQNSARSEGDGL